MIRGRHALANERLLPLPWTKAREEAAERGERRLLRAYECIQIAPGPGQRKPTSYMLSPRAAAFIRAMPDVETTTRSPNNARRS